MKTYFTALLSTMLASIGALPTTQVSMPSDLVIVLDNYGVPFPRMGHRMVSPRAVTPELSSFPADFNDLPFKTETNIDGEEIVIFAQKKELVTKVLPILKQYLCSNVEYAPLFPIMCRYTAKANDEFHQSTSRLVGTENDTTSVRHQHPQSTPIWSERSSASFDKAFDSTYRSFHDSKTPTLTSGDRLITPTKTLVSDRGSTSHDTAKSTGKPEQVGSESSNSRAAKSQTPIDQASGTISSASLSSSTHASEGEQFATISTFPSSKMTGPPARTSPLTADPEFTRTSRSFGPVFSTTQKRPMVSQPEKLPGKSLKSTDADSTSLSRSTIHKSILTTRDGFSSPYGWPSPSLTTIRSEPPKFEKGRSTKSLLESTQSMPTMPRFTNTHPSKVRTLSGGTSTFNTLKSRKMITLTESPSWRTIRTITTTSKVGDHGNGGTGHVGPAPVRTKPEWPKELTGTITVQPYPSSTIFTKRSSPIVGSFDRTMASDPQWNTFGVDATPAQDSGNEKGDETDSNWKGPQNAALGLVDYAEDWVEGVLNRARTEYHNIIDSLSNAVGFVNMVMGWDGEDSQD